MAAPIAYVDRLYLRELQIDALVCGGCGLCASLCPAGVLEIDGDCGVARIALREACELCYRCESACPVGAVRFVQMAGARKNEQHMPGAAPGQIL